MEVRDFTRWLGALDPQILQALPQATDDQISQFLKSLAQQQLMLDQADSAMGDATGRLGEGNADSAVDSQGRALDALRKGAQSLAEAMQQGDGDQPGDGPGNPRGRQQGAANSSDPLGRPMRHNEFTDDYTVKIPGEIDVQRVRRILEELRRRLADPARPQIELDYIERLLKDY